MQNRGHHSGIEMVVNKIETVGALKQSHHSENRNNDINNKKITINGKEYNERVGRKD